VSVVLPTLKQPLPFPVSQELKLEKLILDDDREHEQEDTADDASFRKWQLDLDNGNSLKAPAEDNKEPLERPLTPVVTRKHTKSLMGWEFKRHTLGFGLVRAKPKAEETL
jgi:hypothetical protein